MLLVRSSVRVWVVHFSAYSASQSSAGLNQVLLWLMFCFKVFCIFGWSVPIQSSLDGNKTYINTLVSAGLIISVTVTDKKVIYLNGGQVKKSKIIWPHHHNIWPPFQIWPPSKWSSHASNMAFFAPAGQNPSCAGRIVLIRPVHHLRPWFASCPPVILPPGMKRFTSLNLWIFCSSCGRYLAPFFFNPCPLHECFGWPTFMYLSRTTPLPEWPNKVSIQIRQYSMALGVWGLWGVRTESSLLLLDSFFVDPKDHPILRKLSECWMFHHLPEKYWFHIQIGVP